MDVSPVNVATFSGLIRGMAESRTAAGVDDAALVRLLGLASRWAAHREKLTARFEMIEDVVAEAARSEEHTSELQSLMRISSAVFCLKKKISLSISHTLTCRKLT